MGATYAGVLGLVAFATVLARGLIKGAGFEATLWQAWLAMWVLAAVGAVIGRLAQGAIESSLRDQLAQASAEIHRRDGKTSTPT